MKKAEDLATSQKFLHAMNDKMGDFLSGKGRST